ncbi:hypothetical protein GFB56_00340 [Ensifer sp. T173]|uniref:Uncharacterized protein n=1 Tax=Ensifer canadensis TaxID=555315 RepID=A0AAW4FAW4_9HYPH|nr:hypothetical protein [Ensifer canadensis]MBM3089268.1 hypothetical protein [Ensifer canadensis]UBI76808.1 hypothetical protein J3R84_06685 [Ensifer canadensis]
MTETNDTPERDPFVFLKASEGASPDERMRMAMAMAMEFIAKHIGELRSVDHLKAIWIL